MSQFDDIKKSAQQGADKVTQDHPEQAEKISDQAVQRGGDAAEKATGGKHADQVDNLQEKADKAFGDQPQG